MYIGVAGVPEPGSQVTPRNVIDCVAITAPVEMFRPGASFEISSARVIDSFLSVSPLITAMETGTSSSFSDARRAVTRISGVDG